MIYEFFTPYGPTVNPQYQSQHPPQRQWVGLTYEEQEEIVSSAHSIRDAINKTDWKLKEKNCE